MATDDEKFVQQMREQLEKASEKIEKAQKALAENSSLRRFLSGLATTRDNLAKELDAIPPDEALDAAAKQRIRSQVSTLRSRASRVEEGTTFAEDPRPPKLGAWIWFAVEFLAVVLVAWLYVSLHAGRPLKSTLEGVSPAIRVELAVEAADMKQLASADEPDRAALSGVLGQMETTLAEAQFAPGDRSALTEVIDGMRTALTASGDVNGGVVSLYADNMIETLKTEESFFWEHGVGRYAEVLFAVFFGVMAFALYNNWEYMRHPGRAWWIAWHIAKGLMALVLGFVTIVILSQVNFTTPGSIEDQTALGLGFAPIELVIAISALAGYFSHRMVGFLDRYADRIFGSPE